MHHLPHVPTVRSKVNWSRLGLALTIHGGGYITMKTERGILQTTTCYLTCTFVYLSFIICVGCFHKIGLLLSLDLLNWDLYFYISFPH